MDAHRYWKTWQQHTNLNTSHMTTIMLSNYYNQYIHGNQIICVQLYWVGFLCTAVPGWSLHTACLVLPKHIWMLGACSSPHSSTPQPVSGMGSGRCRPVWDGVPWSPWWSGRWDKGHLHMASLQWPPHIEGYLDKNRKQYYHSAPPPLSPQCPSPLSLKPLFCRGLDHSFRNLKKIIRCTKRGVVWSTNLLCGEFFALHYVITLCHHFIPVVGKLENTTSGLYPMMF